MFVGEGERVPLLLRHLVLSPRLIILKYVFIKEKLPNVCIVKTLKTKGGSKGTYFVEETNSVLKLISQYKKSEKIIEEYPTRK